LSSTCISEIPSTPVDIIGDIHGELKALTSLLKKLGYDHNGSHADKRKLVFVGDLIDRGPDSPGVLRLVKRLVDSGNAQCITGNHELNAVRDQKEQNRSGEGWWYGRKEAGYQSVIVDPDEKERILLPFLRGLPGAVEREDLRVIHACWHDPSVEKLRTTSTVIEAFKEEEKELRPKLKKMGEKLRTMWIERGLTSEILKNPQRKVEFIPELAAFDEANQMGNAVKVATSGMELAAEESFYASGKWRMVRRFPWWNQYEGPPVIVGHYWRRYFPDAIPLAELSESDVFGSTPPDAPLGPEGRVMCIDFSVGLRFAERGGAILPKNQLNHPDPSHGVEFNGCLAALRVPEWQLVFDDGRKPLRVEMPSHAD
jgi:hypothetical protein